MNGVLVGIEQKPRRHILHTVCEQLRKQPYVMVNGKAPTSASTCTEVRIPKHTRISRERRKYVIGTQVYAVIDELRMNNIVQTSHINQYLSNIQSSIKVIEAYVDLRNRSDFLALRKNQLELRGQVVELANKRSKYMDRVGYFKATILSILYKEVVLVDKLSELDIKIDQLCLQRGVSGAPFFEAGKLVGEVWGVVARSLFNELGKH